MLTAFIVESYSMLRPSAMDKTNALLIQMSTQLNSFRINTVFVNSTQSVITLPLPTSFRAVTSSVWINALWFLSLICSISAASLGMIVQQWLHENALDITGTSRDIVRLRQYRYEALNDWHVGTIVAALPLLLLLASALFFFGLLILLWSLHHAIAIAATSLLVVLLCFAIVTTLIPAFSHTCAYRSPQSLVAFSVVLGVRGVVGFLRTSHTQPAPSHSRQESSHDSSGSESSDSAELPNNTTSNQDMDRTDGKRGLRSAWSQMEREYVSKKKEHLDCRAIEDVHDLSPQDKFTDKWLRRCVRTLPPKSGYKCIKSIRPDTLAARGTSTGSDNTPSSNFSIGLCAALIFDVMETYADAVEEFPGRPYSEQEEKDLDKLFLALVTDLQNPPLTPARMSCAIWASTPERLYRTLSRLIRRSLRVEKSGAHITEICRVADSLVNWQYLWSLYRLDLIRRPPNANSSTRKRMKPKSSAKGRGTLQLMDDMLLSCKQNALAQQGKPYCIPFLRFYRTVIDIVLVIVDLEELVKHWAAECSSSLPTPDALRELALAHERLLAFLCTCYLAPRFVEDSDLDFVEERLRAELKAFNEVITNQDLPWKNTGKESCMEVWFLPRGNDPETSLPTVEEWRRRLGGDSSRQTETEVPPLVLEAGVPHLDQGLISEGTTVLLPHILTQLRSWPALSGSITRQLTKPMVEIMDEAVRDRPEHNYNGTIYCDLLEKPWHDLDRKLEAEGKSVKGSNAGNADSNMLSALC